MHASCTVCAWRIPTGEDRILPDLARLHENANAEHRVTVWDSSTSQLPRDLWDKA